LILCVGWLGVAIESLIVTSDDSTGHIGEHRFAVGGRNKSRVGRPNNSGSHAEKNRNEQDTIQLGHG